MSDNEIKVREQDGIILGLAADQYHAIDACSSSRLRDLGRSPAYCRWNVEHPSPATASMILGSLVHALVLEPYEVNGRYAKKDFDARTNAGKARRDELATAGIEVLSPADWDRAHAIAEAVLANRWFQSIEDPVYEVSAFWPDGDHDIPCRVRPDILGTRNGKRVLGDLKVCRQATPDQYPRKAVTLWHPQQLAWYARGLESNAHPVDERWILAVHPNPPHEVTPYLMSNALNEWADKAVEDRLTLYEECLVADDWPANLVDEIEVPLPEWTMPHEVELPDEVGTEE